MSSERTDLTARPGQYRPAFKGPLHNPWLLAAVLCGHLALAVLALAVAWWLGMFWLSLVAIGPAMYAGMTLASIFPREFLN